MVLMSVVDIGLNKEKYKFALIIPTHNRVECIEQYIFEKAEILKDIGVDIIIYDSSDNSDTYNLVLRYIKKFDNIRYEKYIGILEKNAIDKKVYTACKLFSKDYEYIMFSSDGIIVNLELIFEKLKFHMAKNTDMIIYNNGKESIDYYSDSIELFKLCAWRMTSLSSIIFSTVFLNKVIETFNLEHPDFFGLWLSTSCFYYIAYNDFKAVCISEYNLWNANKMRKESFWIESGDVLCQWGKVWYEVVTHLPSKYDCVKSEVLISHDRKTKIFSIRGLLRMKMSGNLTYRKVKEYSKYINFVTCTPKIMFYVLSILPISMLLKIIRNIYKIQLR